MSTTHPTVTGFGSVLRISALPILAFMGTAILFGRIGRHVHFEPWQSVVLRGILPGVLGAMAAVFVERRTRGGSYVEAACRLGLGRPNWRQIGVGAMASSPIGLAYGVLFVGLGVSPAVVPLFPLQVAKFVIAQGIAEEVIFRGLVYRRLRHGRSFARAATLSAVVFSFIHLGNLTGGISATVLVGVGVSLVFAVVLAYPAAYLFERGGNSIWGFGLLHWCIDSIDLFAKASGPGVGLAVYLVAVLATVPLVFALARKLVVHPPAAVA